MGMLEDREYIGLEHVTYKSLPKIGFIALMHQQPIAVGFLRRVEGGYGQIDTLASNPWFGSKIRHEGITKIVKALIDEAASLKLLGLLAITEDKSVIERSKDSGFQVLNQTVIVKTFTK